MNAQTFFPCRELIESTRISSSLLCCVMAAVMKTDRLRENPLLLRPECILCDYRLFLWWCYVTLLFLFPSPLCLPDNLFSCAFFRKRPVPSVWATLLECSTSLSGALAWPCWWLWLSSVTSQGPRRSEWRWQRMHRILTHLPRRIHRILQLIRKVTTYMASKVLRFRG